MVTRERLYTSEELWELSHRAENAEQRFELSEGRLIVMSPAGWKHGGLGSKLNRVIGNFVEEHELGMTTAAETGYILYKSPHGKDIVRAPDVGFIAAQRLPLDPDDLPNGYVPFAPDLAVEVVSPSDNAEEIDKKVKEYLKYGARLVWLFYPETRTAAAHSPTGSFTLDIDGVLDGGDVLPGFELPLQRIFKRN
jgi:Uma2 family endonuclease